MSLLRGQIADSNKTTMLVTEIAYKFSVNENYTPLPIRSMSGNISIKGLSSRPGFIEVAECSAYIPYLSAEMDVIISKLTALGGIYSVRDNAGNYYELGNAQVKAAMNYERLNPGIPGGKYGYDLKITFSSPFAIAAQSFINEAS